MDYGIIISLIIFSNSAFITLLFTRFDINVYTDWAVVTAKVRGNFNIKKTVYEWLYKEGDSKEKSHSL
jgi:hypothetical protein